MSVILGQNGSPIELNKKKIGARSESKSGSSESELRIKLKPNSLASLYAQKVRDPEPGVLKGVETYQELWQKAEQEVSDLLKRNKEGGLVAEFKKCREGLSGASGTLKDDISKILMFKKKENSFRRFLESIKNFFYPASRINAQTKQLEALGAPYAQKVLESVVKACLLYASLPEGEKGSLHTENERLWKELDACGNTILGNLKSQLSEMKGARKKAGQSLLPPLPSHIKALNTQIQTLERLIKDYRATKDVLSLFSLGSLSFNDKADQEALVRYNARLSESKKIMLGKYSDEHRRLKKELKACAFHERGKRAKLESELKTLEGTRSSVLASYKEITSKAWEALTERQQIIFKASNGLLQFASDYKKLRVESVRQQHLTNLELLREFKKSFESELWKLLEKEEKGLTEVEKEIRIELESLQLKEWTETGGKIRLNKDGLETLVTIEKQKAVLNSFMEKLEEETKNLSINNSKNEIKSTNLSEIMQIVVEKNDDPLKSKNVFVKALEKVEKAIDTPTLRFLREALGEVLRQKGTLNDLFIKIEGRTAQLAEEAQKLGSSSLVDLGEKIDLVDPDGNLDLGELTKALNSLNANLENAFDGFLQGKRNELLQLHKAGFLSKEELQVRYPGGDVKKSLETLFQQIGSLKKGENLFHLTDQELHRTLDDVASGKIPIKLVGFMVGEPVQPVQPVEEDENGVEKEVSESDVVSYDDSDMSVSDNTVAPQEKRERGGVVVDNKGDKKEHHVTQQTFLSEGVFHMPRVSVSNESNVSDIFLDSGKLPNGNSLPSLDGYGRQETNIQEHENSISEIFDRPRDDAPNEEFHHFDTNDRIRLSSSENQEGNDKDSDDSEENEDLFGQKGPIETDGMITTRPKGPLTARPTDGRRGLILENLNKILKSGTILEDKPTTPEGNPPFPQEMEPDHTPPPQTQKPQEKKPGGGEVVAPLILKNILEKVYEQVEKKNKDLTEFSQTFPILPPKQLSKTNEENLKLTLTGRRDSVEIKEESQKPELTNVVEDTVIINDEEETSFKRPQKQSNLSLNLDDDDDDDVIKDLEETPFIPEDTKTNTPKTTEGGDHGQQFFSSEPNKEQLTDEDNKIINGPVNPIQEPKGDVPLINNTNTLDNKNNEKNDSKTVKQTKNTEGKKFGPSIKETERNKKSINTPRNNTTPGKNFSVWTPQTPKSVSISSVETPRKKSVEQRLTLGEFNSVLFSGDYVQYDIIGGMEVKLKNPLFFVVNETISSKGTTKTLFKKGSIIAIPQAKLREMLGREELKHSTTHSMHTISNEEVTQSGEKTRQAVVDKINKYTDGKLSLLNGGGSKKETRGQTEKDKQAIQKAGLFAKEQSSKSNAPRALSNKVKIVTDSKVINALLYSTIQQDKENSVSYQTASQRRVTTPRPHNSPS